MAKGRPFRVTWQKLTALVIVVLGIVAVGSAAAAPPPAPLILGPTNGASVTVPFTIAWSAVAGTPSGIVAYNWQVSTSSSFTPVIFQDSINSPTTQDTVSGLANGTYFWRVQAVNGAFEQGAWSATRSFTVTGVGPGSPGTPVLAPTQAYNTFHPFETASTWWTAVPDAATYVLEISRGDPGFSSATTFTNDNIDQTTWSFTIGNPEGNYFSRVYAVSPDGIRGVPSNVISYSYFFNNPVGPPPGLLSPVNGETLTLPVTLKWVHVPNPQVFGYDIEIATDSSFSTIEVLGVQQHFPSVPIRSLTPGTKFWRVFSMQGDDAPATVDSAGSPAVTAPSATGTFTISSAPSRPVSVALEGVDQPQAVSGGSFPFVAVQLTAGVPASGATIVMTSSNPTVAPVPATIQMPGTHAWTNFQIALGQVTSPTPVTLTATLNGVSASGQVTVLPTALKSLQISPVAVSGGAEAIAWVDLNGPAPAGGAVMSLSSNTPAARVPPTVTVGEGSFSQSILVATTAVTEATLATITVSHNGVSKQAKITVTPPRPPASLTFDPISRIGSDPGTATGRVTIASFSAYDQTFELTSSNPAAASVPGFVTVPAGSLAGGFSIFTSNVAVPTVVMISASGGGVTLPALFPVYPAGTAPSLSTVRVNETSVMGGTSSQGTVSLNSAAPSGGLVVTLTDNSTAVTIPATVTVPAGFLDATFTVSTSLVSADTTVTISGTKGTTQSTTLTVTPGPTGPALSWIAMDPFSVVGGSPVTGTVSLSAAAPSGGAVVPLFADSTAATVPASVTVPAGAIAVTFPVTTRSVTAPTAVSITGSFGGGMQFARLNVTPPATGPVISAVTVDPTSVVGSASAIGAVTLSAPAPSGGAEVFVTHASLALAEELLGVIVTVPAGATSATFPVDTYKVAVPMVASIRGTFGGITETAVLTVNPAAALAPALSAVAVNPTSVVGGNSSTGTVTLSAAAPSGGAAVSLSDNSSATSVSASVTVPAGATSANFTVTTTSVTASTSATISAVFAGVTRTAALTVNPSAPATPAAPTLISPAGGATVAQPVTLDWSDVAGATRYEIQVDTSSTIAAPFTVNQIVTASQITLSGLPAQRLWWRVRARNSAGVFGPFSATRRFTPQAAPAAPSLSSLSVSPTSVVGPASSTGTATLTTAAPTGGAVVTLSSNNAAATVPASVTVPGGATSATFTVTTNSVSASTSVTLTGTYNGTSRTSTLTVTPVPPPASLNTLALNPTSLTGGGTSQGTVTLTSAAPSGGAVVTLSSNAAAATVPASVTVPAGATSANFTVTTTSVTASSSATISAVLAGVTRTAALTVNPAGANVTLTVTATGRSGERVISSPAGINVTVGSTGSATFAANTSITLSVTNGRDAIWSGACSSGGNKTKTCTFTITANAAVTGNVQ